MDWGTEGKQNDMTATVGFRDLTGQWEALRQFNIPLHPPSSSVRPVLREIKGFLSFSRTRLKSFSQDTGLHLPPPGLQTDTPAAVQPPSSSLSCLKSGGGSYKSPTDRPSLLQLSPCHLLTPPEEGYCFPPCRSDMGPVNILGCRIL